MSSSNTLPKSSSENRSPTRIEHVYDAFVNRKGRYDFLLKNFSSLIMHASSILDVGCDDNHLKPLLGDKVFGIDIGGTPDRTVDLEKESLSSFGEDSYHLSICTEVLEHVDNFHQVMDDLVRVTKETLIISLPNSTSTWRLLRIIKGEGTGKFYGLPLHKPQDRHKWFFTYKEIVQFFTDYTKAHPNLSLERVVFHYNAIYPDTKGYAYVKQRFLRFLLSTFHIYNYAQDVFVVLKKKAT